MSRFRKLFLTLSVLGVMACINATAKADTITITGVDSGNVSTATVGCGATQQGQKSC